MYQLKTMSPSPDLSFFYLVLCALHTYLPSAHLLFLVGDLGACYTAEICYTYLDQVSYYTNLKPA